MSLTPGARLGVYEIVAPLGAGGMGEVFRARDTRLKRDVALKVLPDSFASDPDRLARFEREAQVLASLNHPHIAAIYGVEDSGSGGTRALVMELVDGPTLADRLAQGPIPIDEALPIARQIAEALEAAHEAGIIHRDLKPANIKLRADGTVKVLDFGLAKAVENTQVARDFSPANQAIANSPTITTPAMTHAGMILGTAAYMSPEQARGKPIDRRADIWAFGCVVYEMLTGRRAFEGDSVTDTIAAVVMRDPDWSALPESTPGYVRVLLARSVAKDPRQRLRDIGDARLELDRPPEGVVNARVAARRKRVGAALPWTIATAALGIAFATAIVARRTMTDPADVPLRPVRFNLAVPASSMIDPPLSNRYSGVLSVSPDADRVAILATAPGGRIWLRALDSVDAQQVPKTEGALQPFWSPDGRSIAFFSFNELRRLDLGTGVVQTLTSAENPGGGTWNAEGTIVFNNGGRSGLLKVRASGGDASTATELDASRQDRGHLWPWFLPDGKHFVFLNNTADPATTGIYAGSLDSRQTTFVVAATSNAAFANGWLLFVRDTALLAQRFDPQHATVSGDPQVVAQPISYSASRRHAEFSVSANGALAYATSDESQSQHTWISRSGERIGALDGIAHTDISPDDLHVAADRVDPQNGARDIWIFDLQRGTRSKLTFSPAQDWVPKWSPDGRKVVFTSERDTPGVAQLYIKDAAGSGNEELLLTTDSNKHHTDWSRDGRFLAFESTASSTAGNDLWILPMTGSRDPTPFLQTPFNEAQPAFSPDTRFLAYASNESGVFDVYVQAFPATGGKWQISTRGGVQPRWRKDGKEMYYLGADGKIMALDVDLRAPAFGVPRPLFQTAILGDTTTAHFAVTSDGQKFLLQDGANARTTFTMVLEWPRLLTGSEQSRR